MDEPSAITCKRCERRSLWKAAFTQTYSFGGPVQLCPHCAEQRRLRRALRGAVLVGGCLLLVPAMAFAGIDHPLMWIAMVWACFHAMLYLSVLPHEFGHALAARAVGYKPLAILWGSTDIWFDRRLFGIRTLIGRAPDVGVTFFEPTHDRSPRLNHALITAAGPATNLLIAVAALTTAFWLIDRHAHGIGFAVLVVVGMANALLFLGNVWPAPVSTVAGILPNDGQKLWNTLRNQNLDLASSRAAACQLRMHFAFRDDRQDEVLHEADVAENLIGRKLWIDVSRSAALLRLGKAAEARELLLQPPAAADCDVVSLAVAQNNLAWAGLLLDDPATDASDQDRSQRAYEVLPWLAPVIITRACVLASRAEAGSERLAEVRRLLAGLPGLQMDRHSLAYAGLARGLAAAAAGDAAEARREWDSLREFGDPGLAGRVLEARIPSR